jgi:hypothetical protein
MDGFLGSTLEKLKGELSGRLVAIVVSIIAVLATSALAYLQDVRSSVIAMFVLTVGPIATACTLYSIGRYKELTANRAKLRLAYDPSRNYFARGNGAAEARMFIHNDSPKHAAINLRVRLSRMEAVGSKTAHPQAAQFNNVVLKLERGQQGMTLRPLDDVEVMGPLTFPSNKNFHFQTEEKSLTNMPAMYFCDNDSRFRMTIVATADNADPESGAFLVYEKDGVMQMEWDNPT